MIDSDLNILNMWDNCRFGAIYDVDNDGINELILARDGIEIWGFR